VKSGEEAVGALLDVLNKQGIEYMVVGSFSSNRYGVPRATNDADLVLNVVAKAREKLFRELPVTFEIDSQVTFEMITGTWRQIIHSHLSAPPAEDGDKLPDSAQAHREPRWLSPH